MTGAQPASAEEYARLHNRALIGYLLKLGVCLDDAQDAAGETLRRMFENWDAIVQPKAWARKTAYNIVVDMVRARNSEGDKGARVQAQFVLVSSGTEDLWMLKEEQRAVIGRIRKLPAAQRAVIALHLDGFTDGEIAEIMGSGAATVRSNLRHAKARLRMELEAEGVYRHATGTDGGE